MQWTAPHVERADEPFVADERTMLQGFLDHARRTLLEKCAGLTAEQLATRAVPPSPLSLLGLVRHVADAERTWFRRRFGGEDVPPRYAGPGDPDAAFDDLDPRHADAALAHLRSEWVAADRAVAALPLDHVFISPRWGPMQLRWAYHHMIGEYDRHNGHADLVRECLDGATGT